MVSIYALINPINNYVFYIGASKSPLKRLRQHISAKNDNSFKSSQIKYILSKGFTVELEILDECDYKDVCFWEEFYIDLYTSYGFDLKQLRHSSYHSFYENYGKPIIRLTENVDKALRIISYNGNIQKHIIVNMAIKDYIKKFIYNNKSNLPYTVLALFQEFDIENEDLKKYL